MKYLARITALFVMAARRERRFSALVAFQRIEEAMENDTVDIDSQISDEEERLSDMEEEELQPNLVKESEESYESEEEATLPRIEDRTHEYRSPTENCGQQRLLEEVRHQLEISFATVQDQHPMPLPEFMMKNLSSNF